MKSVATQSSPINPLGFLPSRFRCLLFGLLFCFSVIAQIFVTCQTRADEPKVLGQEKVEFATHVAPILVKHCVDCHGAEVAEGGLRLDNAKQLFQEGDSGLAIVKGNASESELYQRLITTDDSLRMPLDSDPLDQADIVAVRNWIEEGASVDGVNSTQSLSTLLTAREFAEAPAKYARPVPITAIAFLSDHQLVVSGYRELLSVDLRKQDIERIGGISERIYGIMTRTQASPEEPDIKPESFQAVVAGGAPGVVGVLQFLEQSSPDTRTVLAASDDVFLSVKQSPDASRYAAVSTSGETLIGEITKTGSPGVRNSSHSDWVLGVFWKNTGDQILTCSRDQSAKVIDTNTGEVLASYAQHQSPVVGGAFVGDNEVTTVDSSGIIQRWDIKEVKQLSRKRVGRDVLVVASNNNQMIWIGLQEQKLIVVDSQSCDRQGDPISLPTRPLSIAFNSSGTQLAVGGEDGWVYLIDNETRKIVGKLCPSPAHQQFEIGKPN